MLFAKVLRRSAAGLFWLSSAYLLLTLLVALSDEGQPTGAVSVTNWNQFFYPAWYANPGFIVAVRLTEFAYPLAALIFGFGSLILYSLNEPADTQRAAPAHEARETEVAMPLALPAPLGHTAPPDLPHEADDVLARYPQGFVCVLDSALVLRSIGRDAAALLGVPSPGTLVWRPFTAFLLPADIPALQTAAAALQGAPQATITLPLGLRTADHATVAVDAVCQAGLGPDGQVISLELKPRLNRGSTDDQMAAIWC